VRNVVFAGLVARTYPLLFGLSHHGLSKRPDGNLHGDIYVVFCKNTISQFLKQKHIFLSCHFSPFRPVGPGQVIGIMAAVNPAHLLAIQRGLDGKCWAGL
jgi:hypothetical protein